MVASGSGRYFGFVTGGALPASVAATWLATAWDQNASLTVMSPVAAASLLRLPHFPHVARSPMPKLHEVSGSGTSARPA